MDKTRSQKNYCEKQVVKRVTSKLLICISILIISFNSCESYEFGKEKEEVSVSANFTSNINLNGKWHRGTRVTGNTWDKNDAIGIFAINSGEILKDASIYNDYFNIKYITLTSNNFSDFIATDEDIIYPFNKEILDFVAYYPYKTPINNYTLPIDISKQSPLSDIDIMYATATKHNIDNPDVLLNFSHQLAKLQLSLTAEDNISLDGAVVSFENVLVQGSMNLVDGAINNGEVVDSIIPEIQYNSINNELTVTAIMLPNQNLENINVNILLSDNSNYSWNPGQYILTQNTRLKFSLNLTPTLVELKSSNSSILDWNDIVEDQIIDIQPDYPDSSGDLPDEEEVPTGGTIDNPYTVSGAILKQGETSVWVEGYIMGYAIKTTGEPNTLGIDPSHGQSELNIVLADDTLDTDLGLMLPVMFSVDTQSNTDAKQNLNLKTNNNLIGEKVKILCDLAEYLKVPGGRNITVYEILGSEG